MRHVWVIGSWQRDRLARGILGSGRGKPEVVGSKPKELRPPEESCEKVWECVGRCAKVCEGVRRCEKV